MYSTAGKRMNFWLEREEMGGGCAVYMIDNVIVCVWERQLCIALRDGPVFGAFSRRRGWAQVSRICRDCSSLHLPHSGYIDGKYLHCRSILISAFMLSIPYSQILLPCLLCLMPLIGFRTERRKKKSLSIHSFIPARRWQRKRETAVYQYIQFINN